MTGRPARRRADDRPEIPTASPAVGGPAPAPPPRPGATPGPGGGRSADVAAPNPPDPGAVIDDLRRRLRAEQERALNATEAMRGARAEAAQTQAEVRELQHRLHVRETELRKLEELLGGDGAIADLALADPGGTSPTPSPSSPSPGGDEPPTPAEALRTLVGSVARHLGLR